MIIKIFNNQPQPQRYSFKQTEVVIGRNPSSECSVVINSHTISRNHLKVRSNGSKIQVQDLASSNGSYVNDVQLQPKKWRKVEEGGRVKLAEFQGYLQFQIRQNNLTPVPVVPKIQRKVSSQDSDSSRSRSREKVAQLPFKISDSTFRMLKDMTINKKTKEERIKFLRLMGISKAGEYWQDIEKLLKQKKGMKDKQETIDNLQRQFNQSRSGMEKRGLGR